MSDDSAPNKPCHGPNCSAAPTAPDAATPPAPTVETQPLDAGLATGHAHDTTSGRWIESSGSFHPVRIPVAIFHPPRHV